MADDKEQRVECAIHFVMAQQIRTDAAVTLVVTMEMERNELNKEPTVPS